MSARWWLLLTSLLLLGAASPAPDLFPFQGGWAGADGAYSVPIGAGRTLWLFSDTFWGPVGEDGRRAPGYRFLHNSATLDGRWAAQPFERPGCASWFWCYHGLCTAPSTATVLLGEFATAEGQPGFNFHQMGLWLADLDLQTLKASNYQRLEWFKAPASYGAAILPVGDWIYVYGTRDYTSHKALLLARCHDLRGKWDFWEDELVDGVSNELSVTPVHDGYLLVSQVGADVQVRHAPEPWGPFSAPQTVYRTPETAGNVFTYNAKAHPELSSPEQGLLVSYNVNSLVPEEVEKDARIYRPRFIWLKDAGWP